MRELKRKDLSNGMIVGRWDKRAYMVVDCSPNNRYGNPEKGGRYVRVRAWDVANNAFVEGQTACAVKPKDLRDWQEVEAKCQEEHRNLVVKAAAVKDSIASMREFFESIGLPEVVRVESAADPLNPNDMLEVGMSLSRYVVHPDSGWHDPAMILLWHFGVIEDNPQKESA